MLSAIAAFVLFLESTAQATDLPRILIVGEDADRDTIPRDSRVHRRVLDAIANQLLDQGFDVRDEAALTHETHIQGRSRRSDAELIQIAKDAGIDVLAIFTIYPNVRDNANSVRVTARVEGRLLSVWDGSRLGNFESEPQQCQRIPRPYGRNELLESVGKLVRIIASDVGAVLADRLGQYHPQESAGSAGGGGGQAMGRPQRLMEWTLILDGFSDQEAMDAEEQFVGFQGYDRHRPKPNAINTPTHQEFLYVSSIDSSQLKRLLLKMIDRLNIKARLYMSGNEIKIVKMSRVRQRTAS